MRRAAALVVALAICGCGLRLKPPPPLKTTHVSSPAEDLSLMMKVVDAQGRVDYDAVRKDPSSLNGFVSYAATFSPASDPDRFPTAASRLAYYINAYNALVLYAVVSSNVRPVDQKQFYRRTKMMVGGSLRTLSDIEDEISALKDVRAYFALCGGAKGHPKLLPVPFEPGTIEAQLNQAARAFLNDPRNEQVDRIKRVVSLSEVLSWHRAAFTSRAASLLAFVNRFREDKLPENYKVEFAPFDWSLNSQKEEVPEKPAPKK